MTSFIQTPYGTASVWLKKAPKAHARILIVPGYGESIVHNKKLVEALANHGYDAFTFSHPRRGKAPSDNPIDRQRSTVLSVLEAIVPSGSKVHIVAHSFGTAAALKAIQAKPGRFASVTLMQPAGMVGQQSLFELAKRVGKKTVKNQICAAKKNQSNHIASPGKDSSFRKSIRTARGHFASGGMIIKNPGLALQEARAAKTYDATDDIMMVKKLGIPLHIVKSHSDELFHADILHASYEQIAESVRSGLSIANKKAAHDDFWIDHECTAQIIHSLVRQNDKTVHHP